jgi:hypothetical protein
VETCAGLAPEAGDSPMTPVRAFIVRPFGVKDGIDFDRVEGELIAPVLEGLGIEGHTTEEIARAGNIRTDMFERLLLADLVIADISIHNANVYYELGVRHALRPRTTILIRARVDEIPFDLRTDRYLEYDQGTPGAASEKLAAAVTQSRVAENFDSPVFLLLPALAPSDPEAFRPVPEEFTEAVRTAERGEDLPMLAVLGEEAEGFDWGVAGNRVVGRAQFHVSAWSDARETWESIRSSRPDDTESNLMLATVFQRLGDPIASTAAIERVLGRSRMPRDQLAEALALRGRNAKDRWVADWRHAPARAVAALRSPFLEAARTAYDEAFSVDQNHRYSGINALALVTVTLCLAEREPQTWAEGFEDDVEAQREIERLERSRSGLAAAVRRSLGAAAFRSEQGGGDDAWAELSRADLRLLTADRPGAVAVAYQRARARLSESGMALFPAESAARQLRLYLELDLFTESSKAALTALGAAEQPPEPLPRPRVLVFAGHRIDAPDREQPRFPPASEGTAATMIRDAIEAEKELAGSQPLEGIAGGASGGDILFHEICAEQGIPTRLLLALPRDDFAAESVQDAGPDWMERYRTLCERLEIKVLAQSKELPAWLAARKGYSIWERNNRWMLHNALSRADTDVTLLVLWDGKGGDGAGGTRDMVKLAESRGVRVVTLDALRLT